MLSSTAYSVFGEKLRNITVQCFAVPDGKGIIFMAFTKVIPLDGAEKCGFGMRKCGINSAVSDEVNKMSSFLAHIRDDDGKGQTIDEHLINTGGLAAGFAAEPFRALAAYAGQIHDIGKYRDGFQKRIQGISKAPCEHACIAAQEIHKRENSGKLFNMFAPLLEYCTAGHHSGLQNGRPTDASPEGSLDEALSRKADDIEPQRTSFAKYCEPPQESALQKAAQLFQRDIPKNDRYLFEKECIERYAFLTRYIYSCLTDADFLDTESFCSGGLERGLTGDFSAALERVNDKLNSISGDSKVCIARRELQQQAFSAACAPVRILNMPTGSGKTLCSIKLALESAVRNGKKRIIYVIPYTSIIEQTAKVFEQLFGDVLPVLQHHSNFDFDRASDDELSAERLARCTENWDAPLIVTTNVQFFQSLYHNRSSKLRKLHNIADSVIVFDEVHMMPPEFLQPCLRGVGYLVGLLNCEALFLSATMPDFSDMFSRYAAGCAHEEVITDKRSFLSFRNCRCEDIGEVSEEALLLSAQQHESSLIIVNSRKKARELYRKCRCKNRFCLSTYMTPDDRSKAIGDIRSLLGREPVTVISTSLIEAGVDLDFEAVYRELAGLDSVIQSAGRCNREGRRSEGFMHVFTFEGSPVPRGIKMQANITKSLMQEYDDIFSPECIKDYYGRLYGALDSAIDSGTIYRSGMNPKSIPFRDYADSFNMIDSDTINVIIPNEQNQALIETLQYSSAALRKLAGSSAALHYGEFCRLLEAGVIRPDTAAYILDIPEYYSSETGLDPEYNINTVI